MIARTTLRRMLIVRQASSFSRPAPPPLPATQQREFEQLLKSREAPLSQPQSLSSEAEEEEMVMHPDYRAKPKPRFEGETNPATGEIGGPKTEPLEHGDWSYGGKVTDF